MTTTALDAESPLDDLDDAESPLLHKPSSRKDKDARYHRSSLSVIELDSIPPIIKSANGNIFWADEQCTRRVGLTSTEARLFLRLLQTDEPENYNYDDYKAMFDDFGREQSYLEDLVRRLPWWKLDTYHQKPIWKARIKWLKRMKEPRLWLLYLMARRRRILKQAAVRILGRFKEQSKVRRRMKEGGHLHHENGLKTTGMSAEQPEHEDAIRPVMTNDASQTSERLLSIPFRDSFQRPALFKNHSSFSSHHKGSHASGRDSHSRSSGHCPVFDRPFEATREDIKKIVELLMPKPTPYIVIGWFLRSASDPKERILEFENPADLFRVLRNGERDVRGWRRLVSLKSLKGFGLYKVRFPRFFCFPCTDLLIMSAVRHRLRRAPPAPPDALPKGNHVPILPRLQGVLPTL